jgi:hypothetical protein
VTAIAAMWIAVTISVAGTNHHVAQIALTLLALIGTWFITARR